MSDSSRNPEERGGVHAHADPYAGAAGYPAGPGRVVVTGVDIPFGELVMLILKVMVASIPAYIILFIFAIIFSVIFGGIFAGLIGAGGGFN